MVGNAKAEVQTLLVADGGRCAEDPTLCQLNCNILLRSRIDLSRARKLEPKQILKIQVPRPFPH